VLHLSTADPKNEVCVAQEATAVLYPHLHSMNVVLPCVGCHCCDDQIIRKVNLLQAGIAHIEHLTQQSQHQTISHVYITKELLWHQAAAEGSRRRRKRRCRESQSQ
jgi:hypothetical protein